MSLKIGNLQTTTAVVRKKTVQRVFNISPPLYGQSTWNIDTMGPINISSSGQWTITPTSDFTAKVKMWGAAGATDCPFGLDGGAGGYSAGTASLHSSNSYIIVVGGGGQRANSGVTLGYTVGGGGYGRSSSRGSPQGGGLSGIFQTSYNQGNSILIAGGGGGSGFDQGGAGGGSSGQSGNPYGGYTATGGTQSAGGQPTHTGTAGTPLLGGLGAYGSTRTGGGGGGYFGGGGGVCAAGGSGYINNSTVSNGVTTAGNRSVPANAADPDRGSSGERTGTNTFGNDGRVIIS